LVEGSLASGPSFVKGKSVAEKIWRVGVKLTLDAEEYVEADTHDEAIAIVDKLFDNDEFLESLKWQFQRDLDDSYEFDGYSFASVTLSDDVTYIDDAPANDYLKED
jgi:hypothetical protein